MRLRAWLTVTGAGLIALAPSRGRAQSNGGPVTIHLDEPPPAEAAPPPPSREAPPPDRPAARAFSAPDPWGYAFELGARAAYTSVPIRGGVNPFGVGFGARAGGDYRGFYFGGSVMSYQGGSDVGATDASWLVGGEVGYGLRLGDHVMLRPWLGAGDVILEHTEPSAHVDVVTTASGSSSSASGATTTYNQVYLQPGLSLLFGYSTLLCGIDASSLMVPGVKYGPPPAQSTTWLTYTLEAQVGFRL